MYSHRPLVLPTLWTCPPLSFAGAVAVWSVCVWVGGEEHNAKSSLSCYKLAIINNFLIMISKCGTYVTVIIYYEPVSVYLCWAQHYQFDSLVTLLTISSSLASLSLSLSCLLFLTFSSSRRVSSCLCRSRLSTSALLSFSTLTSCFLFYTSKQ